MAVDIKRPKWPDGSPHFQFSGNIFASPGEGTSLLGTKTLKFCKEVKRNFSYFPSEPSALWVLSMAEKGWLQLKAYTASYRPVYQHSITKPSVRHSIFLSGQLLLGATGCGKTSEFPLLHFLCHEMSYLTRINVVEVPR